MGQYRAYVGDDGHCIMALDLLCAVTMLRKNRLSNLLTVTISSYGRWTARSRFSSTHRSKSASAGGLFHVRLVIA